MEDREYLAQLDSVIDRLLAEQPDLHRWPDGRPANWAGWRGRPEVLRYLARQLSPGVNTIETGSGHSTVLFCAAETRHVAITPAPEEGERIRAYLARLGIERQPVFIHESSDAALARGDGIPERIDLMLIDGAHRFPCPIVDWHFAEPRVPVGGVVAVDDIGIPSVRVLYDFLCGDEDWTLEKKFRTIAFFRRRALTDPVNDWQGQRMNSGYLGIATNPSLARRAVRRVLRLASRLSNRIRP